MILEVFRSKITVYGPVVLSGFETKLSKCVKMCRKWPNFMFFMKIIKKSSKSGQKSGIFWVFFITVPYGLEPLFHQGSLVETHYFVNP